MWVYQNSYEWPLLGIEPQTLESVTGSDVFTNQATVTHTTLFRIRSVSVYVCGRVRGCVCRTMRVCV